MQFLFDPYRAALAVAAAVQFILFLRWLYRRIRNDELLRVFVEDMALNHLPHLYERLNQLCDQQGITPDDPPPIRWINLNGPRH
jgi:hypothetical protein